MGRPAPQADARVVPGGRKDCVLPFRTIDGEEVQGFVGIVQPAHGNDHVAHPEIQFRAEAFLDPELLQLHFAALLDLALPLAGLLELLLGSGAGPGVLELDLRLHGPSLPEVVTDIDHGMRDIEPPMLLARMRSRGRIAVHIVTVEVTGHRDFPIAAHRQTLRHPGNTSQQGRNEDHQKSFH